jgi:hypothetical protein
MRKNIRRMKMGGLMLLLGGGSLMQLDCLGPVLQQAGIGFGRSLGAIPGAIVGDLIFDAINLGAVEDGA